MRASQSASTNIEEEVDLTSGPVINHIEAERSRLHYQQQQQQQQRTRGGPNLIYSPGFSNTLIDGVQVRTVQLLPVNGLSRVRFPTGYIIFVKEMKRILQLSQIDNKRTKWASHCKKTWMIWVEKRWVIEFNSEQSFCFQPLFLCIF